MSQLNEPGPPQKRQRSNSTGDPRKRSEYWFKDGNVVLQAGDTLFRVHQSILSRPSQNFKSIFSTQVPSQEDELIESCPVVALSDTAEDADIMISLLYDSNRMLDVDKGFSVPLMRSMLRLGRKYAIAHIENKALRVLHHDYPKTLEDWDSLSDRLRIQYDDTQKKSETTSQVISIGHEFQLLTILPAAYARYINQRLLVGSFRYKKRWFLITLFEQGRIGNDNRLPEKARERCLIGYARILAYLKEKSVEACCPPLIIPSAKCSTRRKCERKKWQTIKDLPVWATKESIGFGIFQKKYPVVSENLCSKCRAEAKKLTDKVRSEFWSVLPSFFELPAWANLKD